MCSRFFLNYNSAEREYRCLGQWTEDGLIYTYTERRDAIGHECFVRLVTAKGDIYLREAGGNCERGQEPLKYGMRLSQVSKCYNGSNRRRGQSTTRSPSVTRWRTVSPAAQPSSATALPRWREREFGNDVGGGAAKSSAGASALLLALLAAFVRSLSCCSL